ncbi:MAG: hypothetical protein ACYTGG_07165 [Planctomycetota bacterium]|jgi:hypothetical protein
MQQPSEDRPTPEELAITQEQTSSLRSLIRQAKDQGIEPKRDEEELIDLTRGEADEYLDELQNLLDESRA